MTVLSILFGFFGFASAEPVVLPLANIDGGQLSAILPSEKAMILLALALQVIWKLVTYIYKQKMQSEDKTEEKLDRLYTMVHAMQVDVKALKSAPTEDEIYKRMHPQIQITVLETMRKYKFGEKP